MEGFTSFLPLILIVVVMYFLMIRPQQKRQKEMNEMRKNIKRGDKVQSAGGIVGRVVKIKDDIITIETGRDRVRLDFLRSALTVMDVAPVTAASKKEEQPEEDAQENYDEYTEEMADGEYDEYELDEDDYFEDDEYSGDYDDNLDGGQKK